VAGTLCGETNKRRGRRNPRQRQKLRSDGQACEEPLRCRHVTETAGGRRCEAQRDHVRGLRRNRDNRVCADLQLMTCTSKLNVAQRTYLPLTVAPHGFQKHRALLWSDASPRHRRYFCASRTLVSRTLAHQEARFIAGVGPFVRHPPPPPLRPSRIQRARARRPTLPHPTRVVAGGRSSCSPAGHPAPYSAAALATHPDTSVETRSAASLVKCRVSCRAVPP